MDKLLKVSHISKNFSGVQALSDVSFEIFPGERVALVGENGSGKSTIIKIISGFLSPTQGSISIGNITKKQVSLKESINAGIQVIYQDFSLYPNLTVEENLAYNYFQYNNTFLVSYKKIREIAQRLLAKINIDIPLKKLAKDLTVAERQMLSIAKTLLEDAKLIIMDEATTALTQKEIKNLIELINDLTKKGIALLFVSHKLEEVQAVSDRCIFLRNGKKVTEEKTASLTYKNIVQYMSGLDYVDTRPHAHKTSSPPLLEYKQVSTKNLQDISFSVEAGQIVGFLGLLGSGRTELALSLFGNTKILKGDVFFQGKEIKLNSVARAIKQGIGYIPEDRLKEALFFEKSIALNAVTLQYRETANSWGHVDNDAISRLVDEWKNKLKIKSDSVLNEISSLSGGNQQRVVLARWLMMGLKLLVLNRPTVGIDVSTKQEINKIITDLAMQGMSFAIVSDDLPELIQLCHKVYSVKKGKITSCIEGKDLTLDTLTEELTKP